MFKINKIWFTLVELMLVITILSILSTLAFISYRSYSADARDAKRKADVWNLTKQLELRKIAGEELFNFMLNDTSSIWLDIQISWKIGSVDLVWNYKSWDADFVYLDLVGENFTDPLTWDPYKIWATYYQNRYEIAASIEQWWDYWSFIDGTWLPRTSLETQVDILKIIKNTVYLSWSTKSDLLLYAGDIITIDWSNLETYEITRTFNSKLQLDRNIVWTWSTIELLVDESNHIIKSWSGDYWIETNSWSLYTPYNLEL
jgi:prepilin-type N-terminal cleavage/methylation domain-containing protein